MHDRQTTSAWALGLRTAMLAALIFGVTVLGLGLLTPEVSTRSFFWQNQLPLEARSRLIGVAFGAAALASVLVVAVLVAGRRMLELPERLWRGVRTLAPLAPLACVPLMLRWELWKDHALVFLCLVLLLALSLRAAIDTARAARPLELLGLSPAEVTSLRLAVKERVARIPGWSWWVVVLVAVVGYVAFFSYHTVIWHRSVRSGYDLAIEDNILYNILHGGHFFKAAPTLGPTGSHFARHSTLVSYLLVPFYALGQSASAVLILQTLWMGAAAIPLFLFARGRLGAPLGALIAVLYLMHPALQQSNLFEMHYIKLGPLPFFLTIWLLDEKRYRFALAAAALTLMVREDVATWIVLLGVFALAARLELRTSLALLLGGLVYVGVVKFLVMPSLAEGRDELMFMYKDFLPAGKGSFGWAMLSAFTNPAFLFDTLIVEEKLIYVLQILTPLAFLPLRRVVGWVALVPGLIFSLMSTRYPALVDIHYQYSPHLLAWLYPALILVLGQSRAEARAVHERGEVPRVTLLGSVAAMSVATLLCSSQFGAVIQQETSRGGPIPYRFGWDDEGRARRHALDQVLAKLPAQASVAASAFTVTQISNRPDAYSLSLGLYGAEYILATTNRRELVPSEQAHLREVFARGDYGVVTVTQPFFLMRRGHSAERNAEVQALIR